VPHRFLSPAIETSISGLRYGYRCNEQGQSLEDTERIKDEALKSGGQID
jgi:hypothetical protein